MTEDNGYLAHPIGYVHSTLTSLEDAPMQGFEGAPDAWVEVDTAYADALDGVSAGDAVVLLTWFHLADRELQKVHPRSDLGQPLTGVFSTRSPEWPNPIGLHRVTVLEVDGLRLHVAPLEAIDGTPVIDIKPVLAESQDA